MSRDYLGIIAARMSIPEAPTWVGKGQSPDILCVGTEKGRLFSLDPNQGILRNPLSIGVSDEAVNGAVFTDKLIAVSNRSEVVFHEKLTGIGPCVLEGGAHGLIASEEGRILAPMGNDGLLLIQPSNHGPTTCPVIKPDGLSPYFYQTVQIGKSEQGREWFASACRDDGTMLTLVDADHAIKEHTLLSKIDRRSGKNEDFVSLCPLFRPGYPYALVLLSMGRTVYFTSDVRTVKFSGIALDKLEGTPYSIHSAQGHLFILTSEKLYVLKDAAERAIHDPEGFTHRPVSSFSIEVDVVDCSLIDGEHLVLIHENYLTITRVSELSQRFPSGNDKAGFKASGPDEVSQIINRKDADTESQAFEPSEIMATLIGAA